MATDTELVVRYVGGDRKALAEIHDRHGDRVHDLCVAMLCAHDDAAGAFSDTFLVASRRLADLRDPSRLRSWLYAIARNRCLTRSRSRPRIRPTDAAGAGGEVDAAKWHRGAREELAGLVKEARAGLDEREQETMDLHLRHELEGEELADVLGMPTADASKLVQRVRDCAERSLGPLLVARHGRDDCPVLAAILRDRDGRLTAFIRKRIARHVENCAICEHRRRSLLAPGGLASLLPIIATPAALRDRVASDLGSATDDPPPPPPNHEPDSWLADGFPEASTLAARSGVWRWRSAVLLLLVVRSVHSTVAAAPPRPTSFRVGETDDE